MAKKTVRLAGFGPFIYDDIADKAMETDGEIDAPNLNILDVIQYPNGVDIETLPNDLDVENLIITLDFQ